MRPGIGWLAAAFGRRAGAVAGAYARVLDPQGRDAGLVLRDLARYCRLGRSSFVPGDPCQTAFNEGARDVFLHIAEMLSLDAEDFPTLFDEEE